MLVKVLAGTGRILLTAAQPGLAAQSIYGTIIKTMGWAMYPEMKIVKEKKWRSLVNVR